MIIGIPVYDKVDLLDVTGPHEIFSWMSPYGLATEVQLIAEKAGEITTRDGFTFKAPVSFDSAARLDVLWVPGGDPKVLAVLMGKGGTAYRAFLQRQAATARWVCSVCEGALLLAASGLLNGYQATTHWAFVDCLKCFPEIVVADGTPRYVLDRNRLTGGGISSGLDEALKLVELLGGTVLAQKIQQVTQYYPQPPVSSVLPPTPACDLHW